ncbi:MAG: four helix bundle protein [Desulfohalobiaceae bacterium]|nr:four helix bundle protein [Desulfohalobiaceae bacterium]
MYKVINQAPFSQDFGLNDQIWRSSGSAMDNIATIPA